MNGVELAVSLGGLLILSGLFSGTETALFSIPALRLREMRDSGSAAERAIAHAMANPRKVLVTILIGNMTVNILASALAADTTIRLTGSTGSGVLVATGVMTLLVLVLGEVAPKTVAYRHAEPIARLFVRPLLLFGFLLTPIRWPLVRLTNLVLRNVKLEGGQMDIDEVEAMIRLAHSEGEVAKHEHDLIRGVIELGSSPLEDVMTPRTEIFLLAADLSIEEARRRAKESGFSKIPVSAGEPDEMVGVVHAVDLLLAPPDATPRSLARRPIYVPEVKPALDLLEEFQHSGDRVAFVVDEHGHLSGLVTLTDLLEEISGEIIESGDLHKVLYRRVDRNTVVIPGRMEIRFFNEEFDTELEAEEAETMAGLLLEQSGRIPGAGEEHEVGGLRVRVVKAEPNRVVTLEVSFPEAGAETEASS